MVKCILFFLALYVVIRLALDKPVLTANARESMHQLFNWAKENKVEITTFVFGSGVGGFIGLLAWNNKWLGL